MTLPNDARYRITSVGVTSSFVTFTHDIDIIACQGGGKCRVPLIGGFLGVSVTLTRPWWELWLRGWGTRHHESLIITANKIILQTCGWTMNAPISTVESDSQ